MAIFDYVEYSIISKIFVLYIIEYPLYHIPSNNDAGIVTETHETAFSAFVTNNQV